MGTWERDVAQRCQSPGRTETEALHGLAPGTFDGSSAAFRRRDPSGRLAGVRAGEAGVAASSTATRTATYRTIRPDGSVRWLEGRGRARTPPTARWCASSAPRWTSPSANWPRQALQASEERFRRQYKGFPLPTYSWLQVGDDFVLQDYNDAAEADHRRRMSTTCSAAARPTRYANNPRGSGRSAGVRRGPPDHSTRDALPLSGQPGASETWRSPTSSCRRRRSCSTPRT